MLTVKQTIKLKSQKFNYGFTLMEMVLVIIILGIMSVGISGFISLSTQTYLNATNRDEIIGNARFAIERLSRELRDAVPNSIRIKSFFADQIQCIQFVPTLASTVYDEIPVAPDPASKLVNVIPFQDAQGNPYVCNNGGTCNESAIVYPLYEEDIYSDTSIAIGKRYYIDTIDTTIEPWGINLLNTQDIHFKEDSPTQRIYIASEQVSYCVAPNYTIGSGMLTRYDDAISFGEQSFPASIGTRMAGYFPIDISDRSPFHYEPATLKRNAVVQLHFNFTKDGENYVFDHEVHINNVP